ncbi:prophage DNA circulation protein [Oxalobacteraceae bacterium GrIS 1.11]
MSAATDFAAAAQALAGALRASAVNPADAIRLLSDLANIVPAGPTSSSAIGMAMAAMQGATGDLFRRAAVLALARASADYLPTSSDDAAAVRAAVCAVLDREIGIAGDQGQDATFNALRAVRVAVSRDLAARGADLASITEVATGLPIPAPVLAQRLYRDPARADELVAQADPVHPAFMPVSFKALSK